MTARERVRNLISAKIHAADCGCPDFRPDGSDYDDAYYRRLADAVMELFPDAVTEYVRLSWSVLPVRDLDGDHVRYVLRTAPEPVLAGREDALDLEAARRALADPAPSIPLDEVLTLIDQEGDQ